jgi:hypothetical protein
MALTKISTDGVKDDAVTAGKIPANAVGSSELADNAVDTAAIAADAVTNAKLADGSVHTSTLADTAVTTSKINNAAVTNAKIGSGAVHTSNLADTAVSTTKITDGSVTAAKLASGVQTTINTNADNRVITGSGTANTLNGESTLTYSGSGTLEIDSSGSSYTLRGAGVTKHEMGASGSDNDLVFVNNKGQGNVTSNIIFKGSGAGGGSVSEKLRIDSSGAVRIAHDSFTADTGADDLIVGSTNSGINRGVTILNHSGADGRLCFAEPSDPDKGMIKYSHGSAAMQFFVDAAERMRVENLGDNEFGLKFFDSKVIEFKDQSMNMCSIAWSISANTWTNFFSTQSYYSGFAFVNGTHNAGNSSALWSFSQSNSGGGHANRHIHENNYSPASVTFRRNGLWWQINSSYGTYGYAILFSLAGGQNVANLLG